ncbi:MAG: hypothetical protein QW587_04985 [Candidatus Bathyarchaeia archaeon]
MSERDALLELSGTLRQILDAIQKLTVTNATMLDDLSVELQKLRSLIQVEHEEGVKMDVGPIEVFGSQPVVASPGDGRDYFGVTVFNDGPDPVYVMLNEPVGKPYRKAPLKRGDSEEIRFAEAKIRAIYLACDEGGTSSGKDGGVRLHFYR